MKHAFQQVMDGGTPKKIVDSDSKCFTCSSPSANAEKIYIFGKSSIDLQGIIKSSLNVDVSCFANSDKIFVCRSVCYKRLTKLQRSSEKLNEIRQEIEETFKKRNVPRTKRLQRASEELHGNIPEGNHQDQVRDMSRTQEMRRSNRNLNIPPPPRANPGHLTIFCARRVGNLTGKAFPGVGNFTLPGWGGEN